ncbi:MAG: hypothetical protein VX762_00210 [Bacteroidota bacterium]|nr:hypothetical protein [Bacteroidota bacterium]
MKKILLLFLSLPLLLFSQTSGGPDGYGYTWVDSNDPSGPIYNWVDIEMPINLVAGLGDDNIIGSFPLENFSFYWYNVSYFSIGSNGFIAFSNPQNIASPFPLIPAASGANDFIAPLLSDLTFAGNNNPGECYVDNHNVDSTIISFVNVPFWQQANPQYTGSNTFQIILCHLDSTIIFQYKSMNGITNANDITIGIESIAGSIGLQHSQDTYPQSLYSIKFSPPSISNASPITDVATSWNDNNENKGIFLSNQGDAHSIMSNVANVGNQNTSSIAVTSNITPFFSMPVVTNSASISSLSIGQDTTITFPISFYPSTAGTYTFSSQATLVGDINLTNNSIEQEIVVLDTTQSNINLCFANNLGATSLTGINWAGGNGGIAVYFEPSFYPAKLTSTNFGIDLTGSSFSAMIFDDDGPNGSAGTLIDSVFVDSNFITNGWNNVPLSSPYTINEGGVYVLWYMHGTNISLARENVPPISRQSYEVLGGFWATYREYQTEDFFISIDIEKIPFSEDIGVSSILNISNGIVQVEILNSGVNDVNNFNIAYSVNGTSVVSENITSTLLSGNSMNYMFATPYTILPGQFEICSWTDYSADMQHNNDTSCITTTIISVDELGQSEDTPHLLKITDLLGRQKNGNKNELLFYIYDDGTVEKRIVID